MNPLTEVANDAVPVHSVGDGVVAPAMGGPLRILADTSSMGTSTTAVAPRSCGVGAGRSLRPLLVTALGLDSDPLDLVDPVRRIHRAVSRFREPDWGPTMPAATRAEYRYFISGEELDWRIGVAREMVERGDPAAAVWYLRFWAYSLARIPIVWNRAQEGVSVSFLRPDRAVGPDLERHCPDILDDVAYVLGHEPPVTSADVNDSLEQLYRLRDWACQFLSKRGLQLPDGKVWRPFERPSKATAV